MNSYSKLMLCDIKLGLTNTKIVLVFVRMKLDKLLTVESVCKC